ncbi:MAG: hypothetical protein M3355_10390 [Actinomycetota bacterium]|nr:hypothetical protein [Actinomycetota bacterium]
MLTACGGGEEAAEPGAVEGTNVEAAQQTVRNAFADPALLCGELSSDRYLEKLGGTEQCMSQAGAVAEGARTEGGGFTIGEARETSDGAMVTVETPDFGRYVYELIAQDGGLLIDSVEQQSPSSPESGSGPG